MTCYLQCTWLTDVRHSSYKQGVCETSEIPEIAELRCEDPEIHGRRLWEHHHHQHQKKKKRKQPFLIRFGSGAEKAIFSTLYLLTLFDLIAVPFFLCFGVYTMSLCARGAAAVDITTTLIYAIGVALGFRTSFIHEIHASECKKPSEIRDHLLHRWQTWADVLSVLALPVSYIPSFSTFGPLLRLSKCWRMPQSPKRQMLLFFAQHAEQARILQIMLSILVLAHLYACFWFSARAYSSGQNSVFAEICGGQVADKAWDSLTPRDLSLCYMYSLHDGVSMLTGWGNPDALHTLEVSSQIIIALLNGCMMAYIYGLFVAAISFASITEDRFSERTAILQAACDNMHLPDGLRFRVCRYHSYLAMNHMGIESQELIDTLSDNLRSELRVFRMREVLTSAHFFKGMKPRLSVLLVAACTEQVFSPGDMIIRKGEIGDCMYIILRGATSVLIDDAASQLVASLHKNQCFGEASLLLNRAVRTAWIRTEVFTVVSRLDKEKFEGCLNDELRQFILARISAHVRRQSEKNADWIRRSQIDPDWMRQDSPGSQESEASNAALAIESESSDEESSDPDAWMPTTQDTSRPLLADWRGADGNADEMPKARVSTYMSAARRESAHPQMAKTDSAESKSSGRPRPQRRSPSSSMKTASKKWVQQSTLDEESRNLGKELSNLCEDSNMMPAADKSEAEPSWPPSPQGAAESSFEVVPDLSYPKAAARELASNMDVIARLGKLEAQQESIDDKLTKVLEFFSGRPSSESPSRSSTDQRVEQALWGTGVNSGDVAWLDFLTKLKAEQNSIEYLKAESRKIQGQLGRMEANPNILALKEESKEIKAQLGRLELSPGIDALTEEFKKMKAQLDRIELSPGVDALLQDSIEIKARLGRMESTPGTDAWKEDYREIKDVLGRIVSSPRFSALKEEASDTKEQLGRIELMLQPMSEKNANGDQEESSETKAQLSRIESLLQAISDKTSTGNPEEEVESSEIKAQLDRMQSVLQQMSEKSSAQDKEESSLTKLLAQLGRIETLLQPLSSRRPSPQPSPGSSPGRSPTLSDRGSQFSSSLASMVTATYSMPSSMGGIPPSMGISPPSMGISPPSMGISSSVGSPGPYKGRSISIKELPPASDMDSIRGRTRPGTPGGPPPRKLVALPASPSGSVRTPSPGSVGRTGPANVLTTGRAITPTIVRHSSAPGQR